MDEKNISYILLSLDWNAPLCDTVRVIEQLAILNDDKLISQIFNQGGKNVWENFVKLASIADNNHQKLYIPFLLELLKDMNWPGSLNALELLTKINLENLKRPLREAIITAFDEKDTIWMSGLDWLVHNIEQKRENNIFSDEQNLYDMLKCSDEHYY